MATKRATAVPSRGRPENEELRVLRAWLRFHLGAARETRQAIARLKAKEGR